MKLKKIEDNEKETSVVQRRSIAVRQNLDKGKILHKSDLTFLRPCPHDGIEPYYVDKIVGRTLNTSLAIGAHVKWTDLESE